VEREQSVRAAAVLTSLASGGPVDLRGVRIDDELWRQILAAAPRTPEGRPELRNANFTGATFEKGIKLGTVIFGSGVSFERARFAHAVSFENAVFGDRVSFRRARFGADASFARASFGHRVSFAGAELGDGARFDGARFGDRASFVEKVRIRDSASFVGTTFGDGARFDGAEFGHRATFREAVFGEGASLRVTTFGSKATFEAATFGDEASFRKSTFGDLARFPRVTFGNGISFREISTGKLCGFQLATFGDRAWFTRAIFGPDASFSGATFGGRARFDEVTFLGSLDFEEATFAGRVQFEKATFRDRASFRLATFERARNFGPVVALGLLSFDQASFLQPTDVQISANRLSAVRAAFPKGIDLRVRWAQIALDLAEFDAPSLLTASAPFLESDETKLAEALQERGDKPCLVSVRGANVGDLVVASVDLSRCRFVGAHNLDRLRLEGQTAFPRTPKWRGTRRQVIAEEQEWRAARTARRRWARWEPPPVPFAIERAERLRTLDAREIATIYRALRRGRESEGDAPGAGDFYFGEMEMRRRDQDTGRAERIVLWLYWLFSGYGLRGLRSLAALLVTIVGFALLLWWIGFTPRSDLTRAILFSAESTSSLFRVPETPSRSLTEAGEALQIALRLLGPLFFGLALLSLRGRVKR
jgi:uncharacterized protein YjbI with pentapeptide repeats